MVPSGDTNYAPAAHVRDTCTAGRTHTSALVFDAATGQAFTLVQGAREAAGAMDPEGLTTASSQRAGVSRPRLRGGACAEPAGMAARCVAAHL